MSTFRQFPRDEFLKIHTTYILYVRPSFIETQSKQFASLISHHPKSIPTDQNIHFIFIHFSNSQFHLIYTNNKRPLAIIFRRYLVRKYASYNISIWFAIPMNCLHIINDKLCCTIPSIRAALHAHLNLGRKKKKNNKTNK